MPLFPTLGALALDLLGELVAPSTCAACDAGVAPSTLFCVPCAASVERFEAAAFSDAWLAAFEYGGALSTAIARLKYQGRADLGPRLGRAMLPRARLLAGSVDVVVPVPIHPHRLVERGYNQSALLAAPIARALSVAFAPRALERVHDTTRQASLDRRARLENVVGAFAAIARLQGARVLLVDDVRTTGATLASCAAALRDAGAREVRAFVLARRA